MSKIDIIDQLEKGKEMLESGEIDFDAIKTKIDEEEGQDIETPKKRKRRTKAEMEASKKEDSNNEKVIQQPSHTKTTEEVCEEDLKKAHEKGYPDPDFDFRNYYEKGQIIFYILVLNGGIKSKEIKKLRIRTIYPRLMVCNEDKACCQCIGYGQRDMIFLNLRDAEAVYKTIDLTPAEKPKDDNNKEKIEPEEDIEE